MGTASCAPWEMIDLKYKQKKLILVEQRKEGKKMKSYFIAILTLCLGFTLNKYRKLTKEEKGQTNV